MTASGIRRADARSDHWRAAIIVARFPHRHQPTWQEASGHGTQSICAAWGQPVIDPLADPLGDDNAGFAQDAQMVRNGRLADVTAGGEVAGARFRVRRELPNDRQSRGIGEGSEQTDVRVEVGGADSCHLRRSISSYVYIDNGRYLWHIDTDRYTDPEGTGEYPHEPST